MGELTTRFWPNEKLSAFTPYIFKFAAALQAANTGKQPTLIRIDVKAGHGAGKPISKIIDAQSDMWSFVMYHLGMQPKFWK